MRTYDLDDQFLFATRLMIIVHTYLWVCCVHCDTVIDTESRYTNTLTMACCIYSLVVSGNRCRWGGYVPKTPITTYAEWERCCVNYTLNLLPIASDNQPAKCSMAHDKTFQVCLVHV